MSLSRVTLLALVLFVPSLAHAAAGQVLFALGRVEIQRNGQTVAAARGAAVEVGDVVSTGPTGLAQLRMQDGALLSLRYGSSLKVDDYRMPPAAAPAPAAGSSSPAATGGRTALRLLRGAFRTVTGLIGKSSADSYSVVTPVATIGIRGTDYSAAYCSGDCGGAADGLYLGVSNGGIDVANDAGRLALGNDQYGYVRDGATPPARELVPPVVLEASIAPEGEGESEGEASGDTESADAGFRDVTEERAYETGDTQPEGDYEPQPEQAGRYAYGSGSSLLGSGDATVVVDRTGALLAFSGDLSANIGSASNFDVSADAETGLVWGRWHGGVADVTTADGTFPHDLSSESLHWIYAAEGDRPVLALTGSRNYTLIGGTNPTDSNGNVGVLGSGTLFADFTNLTVNSSIDLTFSDGSGGTTQWQASGSGSISSNTFEGTYSVFVGPSSGGSGSFAGFFTGDGTGAGMTYQLNDANFTTTVTGAAGFAESTSPAGISGP